MWKLRTKAQSTAAGRPSTRPGATAERFAPLFTAFLGAALVLGGCQPTPEEEVIAQKKDINEVVEQHTAEDESAAESVSLKEQLGVPATVDFNISINNGQGRISGTDVPVEMPDADRAGAARILRADLTDEALMAMIEKFTGGRTLYEPLPLTKEDLMENIEECQEEINKLKASDAEDAEYQIQQLEEVIKFRQQSMDAVPSEAEVEKVPAAMEWQKQQAGMGYDYIQGENWDEDMNYSVYADKDESAYRVSLSKSSRPENEYLVTPEFFYGLSIPQAESEPYLSALSSNSCKYTQEEAVALCMDFLEDYGISSEGILVSSVLPAAWYNPDSPTPAEAVGYEIELSHGVGSIGQTRTDNHIWYQSEDNAMNTVGAGQLPYDYEKMTLQVTDDGVVDFNWDNPMAMGEVISERVELKSFADIKAIMEEHLAMAYESYNGDSYEHGLPLKITKITFGMMRIQNKDTEDSYTLIPVWDVFGYIDVDGGLNEGASKTSIMTVNAMDGSIVNRNTGY